MSAKVVNLDDHRKHVIETLVCVQCRRVQWSVRVLANRDYYYCPNCEQDYAIPKWKEDGR